MKKKMLIIARNISLSGVPKVYMSFVRIFSSQFVFDILLEDDRNMYYKEDFLNHGGNIYINKIAKPRNNLCKFFWLFVFYGKKVKRYLKNNIDLNVYEAIHSFEEDFSYPYFKQAKKAGVRNLILHICSADQAYKMPKRINYFLVGLYRKKAYRICTSIACSSTWVLNNNNYKNKGDILYLCSDELGDIPNSTFSSNKLTLTQIGSLSSRKNQLFSLEIVKLLKRKYPDIILNIVGSELESCYKDKLDDFIKNNQLEKNVVFLGNDPKREDLFNKTSFILYPSKKESFGLVMIESQIAGIHCFASNTIPKDADLGNVDFLPLNENLWANTIDDYYSKNGNKRKMPIYSSKFSKKEFEATFFRITFK